MDCSEGPNIINGSNNGLSNESEEIIRASGGLLHEKKKPVEKRKYQNIYTTQLVEDLKKTHANQEKTVDDKYISNLLYLTHDLSDNSSKRARIIFNPALTARNHLEEESKTLSKLEMELYKMFGRNGINNLEFRFDHGYKHIHDPAIREYFALGDLVISSTGLEMFGIKYEAYIVLAKNLITYFGHRYDQNNIEIDEIATLVKFIFYI
uniref:Uncharacterized protein n=1 Tax=Parastrongyloides trichosuri TaxID=131310 RepID=A0A0N5A5M7_PARTI